MAFLARADFEPPTPPRRPCCGGGLARSATFGAIVEAIESSNLVVYIEARPARLPGQLQLQSSTPGCRHVRISVHVPGVDTELIAWLGHELWHAVELAGAPDVRPQPASLVSTGASERSDSQARPQNPRKPRRRRRSPLRGACDRPAEVNVKKDATPPEAFASSGARSRRSRRLVAAASTARRCAPGRARGRARPGRAPVPRGRRAPRRDDARPARTGPPHPARAGG